MKSSTGHLKSQLVYGDGLGVVCTLMDFWEKVSNNKLESPRDHAWGCEGSAWWAALNGEGMEGREK